MQQKSLTNINVAYHIILFYTLINQGILNAEDA